MRITRPSRPVWVALVMGATFCHPAATEAPGSEIDPRCLSDLKTNGPPSWRKVEAFLEDISVDGVERKVEKTGAGAGAVSKVSEVQWSLCWNRAASRRLMERHATDSESRQLRVVNPEYRFMVIKLREGNSFQLDSGKRSSLGKALPLDSAEEMSRFQLEAGIRAYGVPLEELLAGKEFRLTGAAYVPNPTSADKRVMIECQYQGSERLWHRAGGLYWAELDPGDSWSVRRAGVRIPATGWDWSQEVTYQPTEALVPFPETLRITVATSRNNSKIDFEDVCKFGKPTPCQRSEDEFYLPYYKIPETALGYPQASRWPRILLFCIGALGVAGFFWWTRSRRKRPAE